MDKVTQDLEGVYVYIDDLLIASKSPEEHLRHLEALLSALKEHGLVVNATKCSFGHHQIEFLGHVVTRHGIWPVKEGVQAVRDFKRPQTVKGLQRFLGMVNFYRRFVKNAAWIMLPLTNALKGRPKTLKWTDNM